jgi:hypothetical protein
LNFRANEYAPFHRSFLADLLFTGRAFPFAISRDLL